MSQGKRYMYLNEISIVVILIIDLGIIGNFYLQLTATRMAKKIFCISSMPSCASFLRNGGYPLENQFPQLQLARIVREAACLQLLLSPDGGTDRRASSFAGSLALPSKEATTATTTTSACPSGGCEVFKVGTSRAQKKEGCSRPLPQKKKKKKIITGARYSRKKERYRKSLFLPPELVSQFPSSSGVGSEGRRAPRPSLVTYDPKKETGR